MAAIATRVTLPLWGDELAGPQIDMCFPPGFQAGSESLPCVLVFRGGAYKMRAGSATMCADVARLHKVVVGDVAYRVLGDKHAPREAVADDPLWPHFFADAARAVRLVRAKHAELGIAPNRVGAIGFSAGGHLVSLLASGRELAPPSVADATLDAYSFVPDFTALSYPFISLVDDALQTGATRRCVKIFAGRGDPPDELRRLLSSQLHVREGHPPTFIWHCEDDRIVPVSQARAMADALAAASVPHEQYILPAGGHAIGLALEGECEHPNDWLTRFFDWVGKLPSGAALVLAGAPGSA